MFSFFKNSIEKDLLKLGYDRLITGYKQKLKNKEITKQQYHNLLNNLHKKHQSTLSNLTNVNVATRQSFNDNEVMVPLNLQNIQQEYIDVDFLYSSLLFEYTNHNRINHKALNELLTLLNTKFPDAVIKEEDLEKVKQFDLKFLINEAMLDINSNSKNYLKAVFKELKSRAQK